MFDVYFGKLFNFNILIMIKYSSSKEKNPGDTPSGTLISIQINVHIYGIHTSRVDLSPAPFIVDMNTKTFSLSELNNF